MKKLLKVVGFSIVGLIVLLLIGAFILVKVIDPNDYKEDIRRLAREKAGMELNIDGQIGWSLFPWLGLELRDVRLASGATPQRQLAKVDMLGLSVKVLPLLSRRIEMSDVRVDGMDLSLEKDKAGNDNWTPAETTTGEKATTTADTPAPNAGKGDGIQLAGIQSLTISNARLSYNDQANNQSFSGEKVQLKTGSIEPGKPIDLKFSAQLKASQPALTADTTAEGQLTYDATSKQARFDNATVSFNGNLQQQGSTLIFNSKSSLGLTLDMSKQLVQLARAEVNADATQEQQGGKKNTLAAHSTFNLSYDLGKQKLQANGLNLNADITAADIKPLHVNATADINADLANNRAQLDKVTLKADQLQAQGALRIGKLDALEELQGNISVAPFNLRKLLTDLNMALPPMADEKTLTSLSLNTTLSGNVNAINLTGMTLKLDETTISGSLSLVSYDVPALSARLKADKLNLDHYLPPADKQKTAAQNQRKEEVKKAETIISQSGTTAAPGYYSWSTDPLIPVESLRGVNLNLELALDQLTASGLAIAKPSLALTADKGLVNLNRLSANLLSGSLNASGQLDARTASPKLSLKSDVRQIAIEQAMQLGGEKSPIRGRLNSTTDLNANGNSQKELVDSLGGNITFNIQNGALLDANIEGQLCQGIALLNQKKLTHKPNSKDTPFKEIKGSLQISKSVANNQDLHIAIPGLSVSGKGSIDARSLSLDYFLSILLEGDTSAMPDPACQINKRYVGIAVPIRCRGPIELGAKACTLDSNGFAKVVAEIAKRQAKDKLENKLEEKLKEKLGSGKGKELGNALKGLLNR